MAKSGFKKGAAGFKRAHKEKEEAKRKSGGPLRFWIRAEEDANVIILDDQPIFIYEHQWKGPSGKYDQYDRCIRDEGLCPLCQKLGEEGRYIMLLSVIDLRKYENRKGVTVRYSRKLLCAKTLMISKFERLFKRKGKGSFRGLKINLIRDSDKESNIGGSYDYIGKVSEDKLKKYKIKSQDGKTIDLSQPFDYDELFPSITEEDLRKRHGGTAPLGNENDDDDDDDLDDVDWSGDKKKKKKKTKLGSVKRKKSRKKSR